VLDREEAAYVCDYIRHGGDAAAFLARFADAVSPGFNPDTDLVRIGCANQTTMLMSESLEIGEMFGAAMRDRFGDEALAKHFRAFDTICSATQERQDAVEALLASERVDLMIVVGGYNSSNTCNLARICATHVRTYHIADPACLLSADRIRHRPVGAPSTAKADEVVTEHWLPADGRVVVGLTAGASTPNNIVGQVIETLERFASA
jgi:4-hydroxy-3-methylbut-2-enyl diphosphate reductase